MTREEKRKIRQRDRNMLGWVYGWYKTNGNNAYIIPDGFEIHHYYYNKEYFDFSSCVVLTQEEHAKLHKILKDGCYKKKNNNHLKKKVLDESTGIKYDSVRSCGIAVGKSHSFISMVCNKKRSGHFRWAEE